MDNETKRTWDGQPISSDPPYGATVVVFRRGPQTAILILHRAQHGPDYEGDWAWTPPAGARRPGEPISDAARRELQEEAGLALPVTSIPCGAVDWAVYAAEAKAHHVVQLVDPEHDRYEWVPPSEALRRVAPDVVRDALRNAFAHLDIV